MKCYTWWCNSILSCSQIAISCLMFAFVWGQLLRQHRLLLIAWYCEHWCALGCHRMHIMCVDTIHCTWLIRTQLHQWSSGRIHRRHRCDPGSIPGWCISAMHARNVIIACSDHEAVGCYWSMCWFTTKPIYWLVTYIIHTIVCQIASNANIPTSNVIL